MSQITMFELQSFIAETYAGQTLPQGAARIIVPKRFTLLFTPIAAAATASLQLNISANGDFFFTQGFFRAVASPVALQTASSAVVPAIRMLVTDSGTDEQWFSGLTDINSVFNNAGIPEFDCEPYPRVVSGRSTLTVQLNNFEAATSWAVDVTFAGVLVKTLAA